MNDNKSLTIIACTAIISIVILILGLNYNAYHVDEVAINKGLCQVQKTGSYQVMWAKCESK